MIPFLIWRLLFLEHGSADFEEFVSFLGERVKLQGWTKYAGGLDVKRKIFEEIQKKSKKSKKIKKLF